MDITLKNVKIYAGLSEETIAFNASVYIDGKKVGEAKNAGHGGSNDVDVRDKDGRWNRDLLKEMETEASKHTWSYEGKTHSHSLDSYIGDLVEELDQKQQLKRQLRGKTAYRIPGKSYKDGEYTIVKHKYTKEVGEYLRERHGDDVFIFNETV